MSKWVSASVPFPAPHFALFRCDSSVLLSCVILEPLRSLLDSNERRKGGGPRKKGRWGESGRSRGRESCKWDILCEGKKSIFNYGKKKK